MTMLYFIGRLLLFAGLVGAVAEISVADLVITEGASDFQVFQRSEKNTATVHVKGTAAVEGIVEASLLKDNKTVRGFGWKKAGEAGKGTWEATVEDIPVGGPYTLQFRLKNKKSQALSVKDILVGDLWVLAGQSNMQGYGDMINVESPSPLVHNFASADRWEVAHEPLHLLLESPDPVHWPKKMTEAERKKVDEKYLKNPIKGAGLGLPFAKEMVRQMGVPIGLVPCAEGGTSMDQWDPEKKWMGGRSLYGSMFRRFQAVGGHVKGVLWYQGESDASVEAAPLFAEKFKGFVEAVRKDFGQPDLPFYYVQIGRFVRTRVAIGPWKQVQEAQRNLAREIPHCGMVPSVDLELDDLIHIGTQGLKRLGKRLANVVCHDLFGKTDVLPGPSDPVARYEKSGVHHWVRVTFNNVNGKLQTLGRVGGFTLRNENRGDLCLVYDAHIDPNEPNTVILELWKEPPKPAYVWYGWGLDPYCNVVDEKDMALPAFGPVEVEQQATDRKAVHKSQAPAGKE